MTRVWLRGVATIVVYAVIATGCVARSAPTTLAEPPTTVRRPATEEVVGSYFAAPGPDTLADAVAALERLEGRDDVATLLHAAVPYEDLAPGRTGIAAPIGFNAHRQVVLRIPDGYDPDTAWPLIVAYHSWGGTADFMLDRLESLLGDELDQFVVAAPDQYRQTVLDAPTPVSAEHLGIWQAVMTALHVDSNRVYAMGYSLGGETVMTTGALHGHRLAAGIGWASTPAFPPDVAGMWEWFAPNLRDLAMLHVWGSEDLTNIPGLNGRRTDLRLAELNRTFGPLAVEAGLTRYTPMEIAGATHSSVLPSLEATLEHLSQERGPPSSLIEHRFRYIHQADTAWVEGHEWQGADWITAWPSPEVAAGSVSPSDEASLIHDLLGTIVANSDSNTIDVRTTHLSDLTVWLVEGVVDFGDQLTLIHNGMVVFEGVVTPDMGVALQQVERTRDFDRIRWAGIRIVEGTAHVVTTDDEFPAVARGITLG